MNRFIKIAILISFSFAFISSANGQEKAHMNNSEGIPKIFSTSEEAVQQGKKDLLALFSFKHDLNVGLDSSQIEETSLGKAIESFDVDFQKLIKESDVTGLNELAGASKGNITPLMLGHEVVSVIDTRKDEDGWKVSGLTNPTVTNDLNQILEAHLRRGVEKMSYYEVPNIHARIYSTSIEGETRYFTNYDVFSFDKPISILELLPKLREDAQNFEKLYGEILKEKHLVK